MCQSDVRIECLVKMCVYVWCVSLRLGVYVCVYLMCELKAWDICVFMSDVRIEGLGYMCVYV